MEVRAEIVKRKRGGDRIAVVAPRRFPGDYEMSKSVPGGRWDKEAHYWHYPLSMTTCRVLRKVYEEMLVIGPQLWDWAVEEKKRTEHLEKLVGSYDATLQLIPQTAPRIDEAMKSRTYQRVGARFIAEQRTVLLADEVSLGKTIQYLGALHEAGQFEGNHLVLGTLASIETVWADEVRKWTDGVPFYCTGGAAERHRTIQEFLNSEAPAKFMIINPEMLRTVTKEWCATCQTWEGPKKNKWSDRHGYEGHPTQVKIFKQDYSELFDIHWTSMIVDEAHKYLLGITSQMRKTQVGEGITRVHLDDDAIRVAATGTPIKGRAINFWSIFHWLRPKEFSSKWDFAYQYLDVDKGVFGTTIGDLRPDREAELYASLTGIMLRRTKREVQPDLPDDVYVNHWVAMSPIQKKQYGELVEEGEAEIEGGSISATGVLAEYTRRKQWAFGPWKAVGKDKFLPADGSPKLEFLLDQFEKRGITGDPKEDWIPEDVAHKQIVFSQWTVVLEYIRDELEKRGIETMMITGSITGKKRTENVRRFQDPDDPCRVLLVNVIAGGAALTLDACCDEMWGLDETWVWDEQAQMEGRIKNRDVEKRVATRFFHYIRTKDTIEQEIAESGLTQDEFQKQLLDRRRGVTSKARSLE